MTEGLNVLNSIWELKNKLSVTATQEQNEYKIKKQYLHSIRRRLIMIA